MISSGSKKKTSAANDQVGHFFLAAERCGTNSKSKIVSLLISKHHDAINCISKRSCGCEFLSVRKIVSIFESIILGTITRELLSVILLWQNFQQFDLINVHFCIAFFYSKFTHV